ncbi:hypothetical protein BBBOND_0210480 [Babesia bigemina]|uniref:Uncharacterized protein n=1 Tax=Babesia bigemina TaxID=5866 RepID=A0A061DD28_BABBI|nr:hypothetical protein BBBOND_0210480 [Babesia bigemina]CDR95895.1 hypothetical protein BBBOND_0210480 [Babesia bigemina]|eukprot:XP_012768081.1 hypothetical protein BBBOND_0210480 [Babesia bigemina]
MAYTSLTEAPHNLKEAVDWLVALKGTDAEKNLAALGEAVHKFLVKRPVGYTEIPALEAVKLITKEFLEKPRLQGLWYVKDMLEKFNGNMDKTHDVWLKRQTANYHSDYENIIQTAGIERTDMIKNVTDIVDAYEKLLEGVKIPSLYKSAYTSEATWDASCAKDPRECALVLVGIAPMLYAGLRSVWDSARTAIENGPESYAERALGDVLKAVGYDGHGCRGTVSSSAIRDSTGDVYPYVLDKVYDIAGFWAFYGQANTQAAEPVKTRKFYMANREVYGIPGVDVDMGLVNAWNYKKGKKSAK